MCCLYLGQVTDNTCVIKTRISRSKRLSFVSTNSLQSKFKDGEYTILSVVNYSGHWGNMTDTLSAGCTGPDFLHISLERSPVHSFTSSNHCLPRDFYPQLYPARWCSFHSHTNASCRIGLHVGDWSATSTPAHIKVGTMRMKMNSHHVQK